MEFTFEDWVGRQHKLTTEMVEVKLRDVEPEPITKYYLEANGQRYPVRQAFAICLGVSQSEVSTKQASWVFQQLKLPMGEL